MTGLLALQITAQVQIAALVDAVAIHLVEQCPETHAEPLRGGPAVAAGLDQGGRNRLTLRGLDRFPPRLRRRGLWPWRRAVGRRRAASSGRPPAGSHFPGAHATASPAAAAAARRSRPAAAYPRPPVRTGRDGPRRRP